MNFAEIAVDIPTGVDRTFSYSIPQGMRLSPGHLVAVPFGNRKTQGIVISLTETPQVEQTKPIAAAVFPEPVLDPTRIRIAQWISNHYICSLFEAAAPMLPPGGRVRPKTYLTLTPAGTAAHEAIAATANPNPNANADIDTDAANVDADAVASAANISADPDANPDANPNPAATLTPLQRRVITYIANRKNRAARQERLIKAIGSGAAASISALDAKGIIKRDYALDQPSVRRKYRTAVTIHPQAAPEIDQWLAANPNRSPKQTDLLHHILHDNPTLDIAEARRHFGANAVNTLINKGWLHPQTEHIERDPLDGRAFPRTAPPTPTEEQAAAATEIRAALNSPARSGKAFLLQGVTGSGKTEVYLDAAARCIQLGKRAIILVPEIALTYQTIERFAARFPGNVGVLHSGLSDGERFDQWWKIKRGGYGVVIGSRSAVFAPQPDLGLIVIDEEHEWTYKQHDAPPRYHARSVALRLARQANAVLTLGSASPDVGTYARALTGRLRLLPLPRRLTDPTPNDAPNGNAAAISADNNPDASADARFADKGIDTVVGIPDQSADSTTDARSAIGTDSNPTRASAENNPADDTTPTQDPPHNSNADASAATPTRNLPRANAADNSADDAEAPARNLPHISAADNANASASTPTSNQPSANAAYNSTDASATTPTRDMDHISNTDDGDPSAATPTSNLPRANAVDSDGGNSDDIAAPDSTCNLPHTSAADNSGNAPTTHDLPVISVAGNDDDSAATPTRSTLSPSSADNIGGGALPTNNLSRARADVFTDANPESAADNNVPDASAAPPTRDLPHVSVVDMRRELREGSAHMFSRQLRAALDACVSAGEQAMLFINRRGSASMLLCARCGYSLQCNGCDVNMTYHAESRRFICHYCGRKRLPPTMCPRCRAYRMRYYGIGTEAVAAETAQLYPDAGTLRWDRDIASSPKAHEDLLRRFRSGDAQVLVGTQMIAKGLHFPSVTLVGVVSADAGLSVPDYRAGERAFQLLCQVAGRAGRGPGEGKVIVQTFQPDHYAVQAAAAQDYQAFYAQEIAHRRRRGNPPFSRLVRLLFAHTNRAACEEEAQRLAAELRRQQREWGATDVEVLGAMPAYPPRLRGRYRWHIALRGASPRALLDKVSVPQGWIVDVDPVSLT